MTDISKTKTSNVELQLSSSSFKEYMSMTKPTISFLVMFTVIPSMLMATKTSFPSLITALACVIGTYLASASAAVFNHIIDADIDQKMTRTENRPVASNKIPKLNASLFALSLLVLSIVILYFLTTPLAALVALLAALFYVIIYTAFLKRYTDQNIVIGGAAGAVGPLIGCAAISNEISIDAWILFILICLWTPPHFWSLAIKYADDYKNADVPMLPVTRGVATTRLYIFLYTLTLPFCIYALYYTNGAGLTYLAISLFATLYFCYKAWLLWKSKSSDSTMSVFLYSCFYLFIIFGAIIIDNMISKYTI